MFTEEGDGVKEPSHMEGEAHGPEKCGSITHRHSGRLHFPKMGTSPTPQALLEPSTPPLRSGV